MTEQGLFVFLTALFVAVLAACVALAIVAENEWDAFSKAHNCKVVGRMSGDVFNTLGVGANGQVVVGLGSAPGKTGYQCDDGITYWR